MTNQDLASFIVLYKQTRNTLEVVWEEKLLLGRPGAAFSPILVEYRMRFARRLRSSIFNTERNSLPRLILTSVTLPLLPFLLLKNCRYVPNFPDYLKIPIFIYFSFLFLSFPSRYDGSMVVRYFTSLITGGSTPSASLKSLSLNRALGR